MKILRVTETHGWTVEELRQQEKRVNQAWQYKRIASVRMVMEGLHGVEIASVLGLNRKSVSEYVRLFTEGGLDRLLKRKTPPGKQPYLSETEQKELTAILRNQTPCELELGQETYWNTKLIQELISDRFDVGMTREAIRQLLHRLGFRYTRPTYVLMKANAQAQQNCERELDMIKKT